MLDIIENNSILLVPQEEKKEIIKNNKKLINIKIMTLEEFIKRYTFDYDKKTIYYLMKKYNIKYGIAKTYLTNLYYIEEKEYKNSKLNKLVNIKKELEENNLLIIDEQFKKNIQNKKIYIYGYDYIEKNNIKILNDLRVNYIEEKEEIYNNQELYEFKTKTEEINFLATKILELKEKNISLNDIKIIIPNEEYSDEIEKIFKMYDININKKTNIYSTYIVKLFLNNLNKNKNEIIDIIKEKINLNNENNIKIYNKIIDIINEYTFEENLLEVKEILINELKDTYILKDNYKEQIEFINLENTKILNDKYIFMPGFNIGNYPKIKEDNEYITDNVKQEINLNTTLEINKKIKNIYLRKIKSIKNLFITYRTFEVEEYYISTLNDELKLIPNKEYEIPFYNKLNNKLMLSEELDLLKKYNQKSNKLSILYNNYKDIKYNTYDNSFTYINKELLNRYVDNKLLLSYSSINNYYNCKFKYYIENILKLNKNEEKFTKLVGNLFHHILEKAFNKNFDLNKEYNNYLNSLKKEFTYKEKVFLENLKEEIKFIIETIKKQYEHISLKNALYEEKVYINKNLNITFEGVIDKLLYTTENDITYVAIIDYKTGDPNLDLNNIIYGIDMQLPIYIYLAKRTKKLKNVEVLGFYLQKILNKKMNIEKDKEYQKQKEENLKLQGYSIDDINLLEKIDDTYSDSEIIKSLKLSKKGFYSYSKVINKKTIEKIDKLVEEKIEEAIKGIQEAKFIIDPKEKNGKNISCVYCKYKDICYKNEKNIIKLKEYKNLEFLDNI